MPRYSVALNVCASSIARADDIFRLRDQALVSPGYVFWPDFTFSSCIDCLGDRCGWRKVFLMLDWLYFVWVLNELLSKRGGVAGFSNGCAILFSNLVLAVFILRIYWFKSIWKCQSAWMVWSGDDPVLHWFHFNLKLCIGLGGSLSRVLVSFCWICSHAGRKSLSCLIKKLIFLKLDA